MFKFKAKRPSFVSTECSAVVCTPDWFAMSSRCARLRRELKANKELNGI